MKIKILNSFPAFILLSFIFCLAQSSCREKSKGLSVAPYNQMDSTDVNGTANNTTAPANNTTGTTTTGPNSSPTNTTGMLSDTATHTGRTTAHHRGTVHVASTSMNKPAKIETDKQGYYNYMPTAPVFAGGQSALEAYINKQVTYPEDALENNVEGTVMVKFTIDENGKVGNVQTTGNQFGYGLEEAAMKVISQMPRWTPGTVNGKKAKGWYTIPVTFKIEE
jgi:protein TonB